MNIFDITVGDYQVLKMGDISRLKNTDARVLVKITDDDKLPERTAASNKKAKACLLYTSAKANALKKDEYKDFSAVEAAVNAVVRDKNITEPVSYTHLDVYKRQELAQPCFGAHHRPCVYREDS